MFENLQASPPDPLLGIITRFRQDPNPNKIDLGVGVYKNDDNHTPVLASVKKAEQQLWQTQDSKSYLGPAGNQSYTELMNAMILGERLSGAEGRLATLQTPGGCGALRVAAEVIVRAKPKAALWASDPTWANHVPLLGGAGIDIKTYPYYDYVNKHLRFDDMLEALVAASEGDLVLLHACCHNPCGADLTPEQWQRLMAFMLERKLIPLIDMAYQGFGDNLDDDAYGLRLAIETLPEVVFAVSCSKNFGLYRERTGLVGFLAQSGEHAATVMSNMAQLVRGIYSMPPDHGAAIVAQILSSPELKREWVEELAGMRGRIVAMREGLVDGMKAHGHADFEFVMRERGMFSFLGITSDQVARMASEYGIYMADSSRVNIAGLNRHNLPYFCSSLASVIG